MGTAEMDVASDATHPVHWDKHIAHQLGLHWGPRTTAVHKGPPRLMESTQFVPQVPQQIPDWPSIRALRAKIQHA
eukprot:11406608-Alexandrium_andersonii.AAC.1